MMVEWYGRFDNEKRLTMKVPSKTPEKEPGTYRKPAGAIAGIEGCGVTSFAHSSSY